MTNITIRSIHFNNYKAFADFKISLDDINILVGPNNSGKSTILSALRLLDIGIKKAYSKTPTKMYIDGYVGYFGHYIDSKLAGISLENVSTDYNNRESKITFTLSNRNKLLLVFPDNETCVFLWQCDEHTVSSPSVFRKEFPLKIQVIPVLGPLESEEPLLTDDTVNSALSTHRASRHFRNFWWKNPEGWDEFRELIERTWQGMSIKKPELIDHELRMFCSENRIDREVFWAGFGFQIWCQLLTHLSRAKNKTLVVIDEPEIYLHPDVQRQLMGILRELQSPILIATHSVEILTDAEPAEIIVVDKTKNTGLRLKDIKGVQHAIEFIGSSHNILLAQLARTRKMLFVENISDYKTSLKLAKKAGYDKLYFSNQMTPFESNGFANWEEVKAFAKGIDKTIDEKLLIAIVLDRDYYPNEQLNEISDELKAMGVRVFIHKVKEIENYLLDCNAIQHIIEQNSQSQIEIDVNSIIDKICEDYKTDSLSSYISKRSDYFKKIGIDSKTSAVETITWFEQSWNNKNERLKIVPGKAVLSDIRKYFQDHNKISLSENKIIESMRRSDLTYELKSYLEFLNDFNNERL